MASIAPDLTSDWIKGERIQNGLDRETDAERIRVLGDFRVDWIVFSNGAVTGIRVCDYTNHAVKVCRVPSRVRP